jgi:hypothetical protein
VYRVLVGRPEEKRPLERPRRRWEDRIKMDLRKIGSKSMEWVHLAKDMEHWRTLVNAVINLLVLTPQGLLAWKNKNRKCRVTAIHCIVVSHLKYIKDKQTVWDIWKSLTNMFKRKELQANCI